MVNQLVCSVAVLNLAKHNLGHFNGVVFNCWSKTYSICRVSGLSLMH